jgi:nitroreductase
MQPFKKPVTEIIPWRYSCREYQKKAIFIDHLEDLTAFLRTIQAGPQGASLRFELVAATEQDRSQLKGLGTYGLIRNTPGFMIGAVGPGVKNMEDFGYGMEIAILYAAELGLGTCWLGGNFTRSTFTRKIQAAEEEIVPCVAAVGYPGEDSLVRNQQRKQKKSHNRLPWEKLFFHETFEKPLSREEAGDFALPLEMVRLAPSSRNTQPWRVVREDDSYHFYLARSGGYGPGSIPALLLGLSDLQRVDVGIAMCHFELAAQEQGVVGEWVVEDPGLALPEGRVEYVASWEQH